MLQWDIIAGSSSEVGSTHPGGLAERTPDQAEWRHCPLLVYTLTSRPGWRRLGSALALPGAASSKVREAEELEITWKRMGGNQWEAVSHHLGLLVLSQRWVSVPSSF